MPAKFPKDAEHVWAKQIETGHERAITRAMYEYAPDEWDLLKDRPATDAGGNPLPAKNKTSVSSEAAKKATTGRQAATNKENS